MKIAIISQYLPTGVQGGVPRQVNFLGNKLIERGHEVTVFSLYERPPDAKYNVAVVKLPFLLQKLVKYKKALGGFFFPVYVAREDFSNFDIIHAHGDSHFIFTSKPVLRTFHGSALEEALHANSIFTSIFMLCIYPFEVFSGLMAKMTVAVSKATLRFFPFIKHIIYNGIDLSKFKPGQYKSENPSILFLGRLDNRKRGRLLINIFKVRIKKEIPNVQLWMVCDTLISEDGIKVFSNINDDALIKLYQKAHVFCMPSSYEGFGIPYVEAMACGTPVITTPNPGAKEVLGNGEYGIISDRNFLADALIDLLNNKKRRESLIIKGLRRAQEFDLEKMVDSYEQRYEDLVGKMKLCR